MAQLDRNSSAESVIAHLREIATDGDRDAMTRYGINVESAIGVQHGVLRSLSKTLKRDHDRAIVLWNSGISEARVLASMTGEPKKLTPDLCRRWADDFNSWDLVDSVSDLFSETAFRRRLIEEFAADEREFVRRCAFAMIAWANVGRKKIAEDERLGYLPLIERHATDPRNFVKKAVNWALRQTGKASFGLHAPSLALAERLAASADRTARWIGKDAVRELTNEKTLARIAAKS